MTIDVLSLDSGALIALLLAPALVAAAAFGGLVWTWARVSPVESRLQRYFSHSFPMDPPVTGSHGRNRMLAALRGLAGAAGRVLGSRGTEKLRAKLAAAGRPSGLTPQSFFGLRLMLAAALAAAGLAFGYLVPGKAGPAAFLLVGVAAAIGYRLPSLWLERRIKARRERIQCELPDGLDFITVSVEAGLTLDAALAKLGERLPGKLADEFGLTIREMGLGKPRRVALKDLAGRAEVPELRSFVAAVLQADEVGGDIGGVLRAQAAAARVRRRQRAQKLALEAPVKIVFPLVFFILPATFVVILGPAAVSLLPMLFR